MVASHSDNQVQRAWFTIGRRPRRTPPRPAADRDDDGDGPSPPADLASRSSGAETRIIRLVGDLRGDTRIHRFMEDCKRAMCPGRRRIVLDLAGVHDVDTKLVAALVLVIRRARAARVACKATASPRLRDWLDLCQVRGLVQDGDAPRPARPEPGQ